jgi:hypothetical protein
LLIVRTTSAFPPGYRAPDGDVPGVRARAEAVTAVVPVPEPDPEENHKALAAPATAKMVVRARARTVTGARMRRLRKAALLFFVTVIGTPGGVWNESLWNEKGS